MGLSKFGQRCVNGVTFFETSLGEDRISSFLLPPISFQNGSFYSMKLYVNNVIYDSAKRCSQYTLFAFTLYHCYLFGFIIRCDFCKNPSMIARLFHFLVWNHNLTFRNHPKQGHRSGNLLSTEVLP